MTLSDSESSDEDEGQVNNNMDCDPTFSGVGLICRWYFHNLWFLIHQSQCNNTICQHNTQQSPNQPNYRKCRSDQFPGPNYYQKNRQPRNRLFL